jgi:hypothetical protein
MSLTICKSDEVIRQMCIVTHILFKVIGQDCLSETFAMCNVTHFLFVIGQDMMRLPFRPMYNVTHILLVIGQDIMRLPFRKICNVIHYLLVIGQDVMRLPFRTMCNVTHLLLVIGQDVTVRLPFRKCAMSLMFCLSWDKIVTTQYGLLHYANLICRTGPICFLFQLT